MPGRRAKTKPSEKRGPPKIRAASRLLGEKSRLEDGIQCRICGEWFKALTYAHLATHEVTPAEYKEAFGVDFLACEESRLKMGEAHILRNGEQILAEIRRIHKAGNPIYYDAVRAKHRSLHTAAVRWWGNWPEALRAAGFDPSAIAHPDRRWDEETVLRHVRRRRREGKPLNRNAVNRDDPALCAAGCAYFGKWADVLRAAGYDPDKIRTDRRWTNDIVIREIRKRKRQGKPLTHKGVSEDDLPLFGTAVHYFGSWRQALQAAGLAPDRYRQVLPRWTKERIFEAIRDRARRGLPINAKAIEPRSLADAGRRLFGSWASTLEAAGFDPPGG